MAGDDAMDVDVSGLFAGTEIVQHPGGLTTIGYDLLQQDPAASIATIVASNSGRPAGACRNVQGRVERGSIHGRHSTQEEDAGLQSPGPAPESRLPLRADRCWRCCVSSWHPSTRWTNRPAC